MIRTLSMAAAAWCVWTGSAAAQSPAKPAEVGRLFQQNCMSCHQPPDLQFATDRAWLGELKRTA